MFSKWSVASECYLKSKAPRVSVRFAVVKGQLPVFRLKLCDLKQYAASAFDHNHVLWARVQGRLLDVKRAPDHGGAP